VVRRAGRTYAAYDQTSSNGFPLARRAPDDGVTLAEPRTTLEGELVGWVLQAMDGSRSLLQLELEAHEQFGNRFTDPEDALQLVRQTARELGE
jgi:hypothetical protein